MKYLESYSVWEDTKDDPIVSDIIKDSFIDLIHNKMGISTQIQRKNNIILIYITGSRVRALVNRDFSFEDIKYPVNHLISTFKKDHPLISIKYFIFDTWKTWYVYDGEIPDNVFGDTNIKNISSFELKFRYV